MGANQFSHGLIIGGRKKCNECKRWKHLKLFHPNKSCLGGVTGTCRECNRVRINKWYKDNRTRRQDMANRRNQRIKQEIILQFGNRCYDCKQQFQDCVYDFHHLDMSTKDFNPSAAITMGKEKREAELSKCIMLCANCHRIRHFGSDITERKRGKDARTD